MALRVQRPLNQAAAQAADNDVYGRHEADPTPNALYDSAGARKPLDPNDPAQDGVRGEWMEAYAANGGKTEQQPPVTPAPGNPVAACPELANLNVHLVHACDKSALAGGTVRISGPQTREATTDAGGWAHFEQITPGQYSLRGTEAKHQEGTGSVNVAAGTTTVADLPLQTLPKIQPAKASYTVVLDKTGNPTAAFPILEFQISNGRPGHLFDVQLSRTGAPGAGPGLTGSWVEADGRDARMGRASFSSWSNGQRTLRLDGSGAATFRMPLEWWRDQARQQLSAFTEFNYSFRVITFQAGPTPVCGTSAMGSVTLKDNLTKFQVVDLGYTSGGTTKSIRMEIKVREANTTEMYTFVQWKMGGRETYAGTPPVMTRPVVKDYNVIHQSDYPVWQLDRVGTNPRYWDGNYSIDADGLGMNATDAPNCSLPAGSSASFTHIDFDTRVHLNFEVPATVTVTRKDGAAPTFGVVVGVIADPKPINLATGTWNTRVLISLQADGTSAVTHPASFAGP